MVMVLLFCGHGYDVNVVFVVVDAMCYCVMFW